MDELLPQKPFHGQLRVYGSLISERSKLDNLYVVIQYSLIKPGIIVGKVLGTSSIYTQLTQFFGTDDINIRFSGKSEGISTTYVEGNGINFRSAGQFVSDSGDSLGSEANLEFGEIKVITELDHPQRRDRLVEFLLAGAPDIIPFRQYIINKSGGSATTELTKTGIELGVYSSYNVSIRPKLFYHAPSDEMETTTRALSLCFVTHKADDSLSDEDLAEECKEIANNILLLISFISRRWVYWFSYDLLFPVKKWNILKPRGWSERSK